MRGLVRSNKDLKWCGPTDFVFSLRVMCSSARDVLSDVHGLTAIRRMGLIAVTPVLCQTHAMRVFADCDAKLRRSVQNENLSWLARIIAVLFHSIACLVLLCVIRSN